MPHKKRKGERPDGLIQVSLQIGYKDNGKPDRKYFYGHSRAEAERKRDEFKAARAAGSSFSADITVSEWISVFKSTYRKNINPAYIGMDDVPYNRLSASIGWMRVVDVRESDLQSCLNAVSGMSFSTVDKYAQCIRRLFLRAQKNKIIRENPSDDLILPPFVKGSHRALDRWEVDLILSHWDNRYAVCGIWILLMLLAGLRRGEMMALDWKDVDLVHRSITVSQVAVVRKNQVVIEERAKTDAGLRTIPMARALWLALSAVPEEKRSGLVCRSSTGKPLTGSIVRRAIPQFCRVLTRILNNEPASNPVRLSRAAESERDLLHSSPDYVDFSFTCHDLRHTFATALYDAGVPVKAAQYFLGHSDIRVTLDLYTHLSKERDAASRQQLISLFDSWLSDRLHDASELSDPSLWQLSVVSAPLPSP